MKTWGKVVLFILLMCLSEPANASVSCCYGQGQSSMFFKSAVWTNNSYAYNNGKLFILNSNQEDLFDDTPSKYHLIVYDMNDCLVYDSIELCDFFFICALPYEDSIIIVGQTSFAAEESNFIRTVIYTYNINRKKLIQEFSDSSEIGCISEIEIRDVIISDKSLYLLYDDRIDKTNISPIDLLTIYKSNSRIMNRIESNHCGIYNGCIFIQEADGCIYCIDSQNGEGVIVVINAFLERYPSPSMFCYVVLGNSILYHNKSDSYMHILSINSGKDRVLQKCNFKIYQLSERGLLVSSNADMKRNIHYISYEDVFSKSISDIANTRNVTNNYYKDVFEIPGYGMVGYSWIGEVQRL